MALVLATIINSTKARVGTVYTVPAYYPTPEQMPADVNVIAVEVDTISEPDSQMVMEMHKGYEYYINPITKEQWFEYFDRPLTSEEILQQRLDEHEMAIAAILGGV